MRGDDGDDDGSELATSDGDRTEGALNVFLGGERKDVFNAPTWTGEGGGSSDSSTLSSTTMTGF